MRERIVELIPEFNQIKDKSLREKTLNVFEKALRKGGWKPDDLLRMPFTLLIENCPANMVEHIRAVTRVAIASSAELTAIFGSRMPIDPDILISGAILHDVGKLVEYEEKDGKFVTCKHGKMLRHPFSGVGLGYDEGLPDEVLHIIAVHAREGDKARRIPAAFIVNHADFMTFEPFHG
jgi:putative nucleotidyltransferase with HDIG domain